MIHLSAGECGSQKAGRSQLSPSLGGWPAVKLPLTVCSPVRSPFEKMTIAARGEGPAVRLQDKVKKMRLTTKTKPTGNSYAPLNN